MQRIFLTLVLLVLASCAAPLWAQKFDDLAQTPPMGWNSWNTFSAEINERLIHEIAEAMIKSGMQEAGYVYIVLDDTWSAMKRDEDGNLVADPEKFPSGIPALADFLHEKGFKFGIYSCAGTKTCAGHPGSHGHEAEDARLFASWGVDYLKYDWCNTDGADARERYSKMRDALHAAGRPVVFSMCEWGQNKPWLWAEDVAHLWRTTGDITDCWDCRKRWSVGWKQILDAQVGLEFHAGPGHWNDPDMLEVGNPGLSLAESRAHFSLWCILAAPLMAGNDVRHMSDEIRDILIDADAIAIDQDPLGKQGYRVWAGDGYEIWFKELKGRALAACVLNTGGQPAEITFDWDGIETFRGRYTIRDLWEKKDAGTTEEAFRRTIAGHDVTLLRLTPIKKGD